MRQVVLDTETTGLEWKIGNRVVEIGCVELLERRPSGKTFHRYINPQREFEQGAQEVTGLTLDFLADKPLFADIIDDFLAFIDGAELVIHNAAFDVGFLDHELSRAGDHYGRLGDRAGILDTLALARQKYPGQRNSLDALCRRLGVDNSHRQLHGALLDAQLLAEAYLAMTSGQGEIGFGAATEGAPEVVVPTWLPSGDAGVRPRVIVSAGDVEAHLARMAAIAKKAKDGRVLWPR
ncbi:MAG: DNA polymerase III subunit epsilon [Xanthomonadales bacterium]|nr:DNA polymerase III subunit epsilon [Xanthomonadales bacterium]